MTILNLTHNDLDGAGSAVMVLLLHGKLQTETIVCNYDDIDTKTRDALGRLRRGEVEEVIFTDIAPGRVLLQEIERHPEREHVTILDHHANNDWASWYRDTEIPGVFTAEACGTLLSWQHLHQSFPAVHEQQIFANIVDAYDRWLLDSPLRRRSEQLQAYFSLVGFSRFVDTMHERLVEDHSNQGHAYFEWEIDELPLTGEECNILDALQAKDEAYIERRVRAATIETDDDGRRFAWVIASRCTSAIGGALASLEGADYGAVWVPEHRAVQLRSVPGGLNVGQLARERGGGGHDHAAGYPVHGWRMPDPKSSRPAPDSPEAQAGAHMHAAASLGVHQTAVQLADELALPPAGHIRNKARK